MHDEDNSLGLWVRNRRGEVWKAYGDKKLFEKGNENNARLMKECLQASVDEVYEAFKSKVVPANTDGFKVWQIAPTDLAPGNHYPLFDKDGKYRPELEDPNSQENAQAYSDPKSYLKWNFWEGYRILAVKLSQSAYFKGL